MTELEIERQKRQKKLAILNKYARVLGGSDDGSWLNKEANEDGELSDVPFAGVEFFIPSTIDFTRVSSALDWNEVMQQSWQRLFKESERARANNGWNFQYLTPFQDDYRYELFKLFQEKIIVLQSELHGLNKQIANAANKRQQDLLQDVGDEQTGITHNEYYANSPFDEDHPSKKDHQDLLAYAGHQLESFKEELDVCRDELTARHREVDGTSLNQSHKEIEESKTESIHSSPSSASSLQGFFSESPVVSLLKKTEEPIALACNSMSDDGSIVESPSKILGELKKFISPTGLLNSYLKQRHQTFFWRDFFSNYVSLFLGTCFGYKTEQQKRENYVKDELIPLIEESVQSNNFDELKKCISRGISSFSPRAQASAPESIFSFYCYQDSLQSLLNKLHTELEGGDERALDGLSDKFVMPGLFK